MRGGVAHFIVRADRWGHAETAHSLFSSAKSKGKHPIQLSAMVFKTPGFFAFSSTKYPALPKETTI